MITQFSRLIFLWPQLSLYCHLLGLEGSIGIFFIYHVEVFRVTLQPIDLAYSKLDPVRELLDHD